MGHLKPQEKFRFSVKYNTEPLKILSLRTQKYHVKRSILWLNVVWIREGTVALRITAKRWSPKQENEYRKKTKGRDQETFSERKDRTFSYKYKGIKVTVTRSIWRILCFHQGPGNEACLTNWMYKLAKHRPSVYFEMLSGHYIICSYSFSNIRDLWYVIIRSINYQSWNWSSHAVVCTEKLSFVFYKCLFCSLLYPQNLIHNWC